MSNELLIVLLGVAVLVEAVGFLWLIGKNSVDITALMAYANEVDMDLTSAEERLDHLESPEGRRSRERAIVIVQTDDERAAREARIAAHRAKKRERTH